MVETLGLKWVDLTAVKLVVWKADKMEERKVDVKAEMMDQR